MSSFLFYILKSSIGISLLYGAFRLFMRKETFFALNRAILLAIVLVSTAIPLVSLPPIFPPIVLESRNSAVQQLEINPIVSSDFAQPENATTETISTQRPLSKSHFSWATLIQYSYWGGVLIAFLILIHGVGSVLVLFRNAKLERADGYKLVIVDHEVSPFSFTRIIVISRVDYENHQQSILTHEQAHIRLNHFFDLGLLEVIKIAHWFNPFIYLLIKDMKEIHEFQADEYTLNTGIDAKQYQFLIIQKSVGKQRFALANSFNHCQIKKRIIMMNKSKTSKAWRWKVATFLPLLALLLMAFANRSEVPNETNTLNEKVSMNQSVPKNDVESETTKIVPMSLEKNSHQNMPQEKEQTMQASEKTVKGKVVDANEKPLEGATVVVSGKAIGTVTDKDGIFSLNLNDASPIVISYVGFKSVKLAPDFEKLMLINLQPENIGIDKVVVVAYGIQKKQESAAKDSNNESNPNSSNKKIFTIVEQMPEFPGGAIALRKHIAQQVKYPASAQEAGIQGNVFVSFVINSFGAVSDVKVVKSVDPALDHEAIRVIYSMPKWKPGFQQGKAVDVAYTMPIEFILQYDPPAPSTK
jgi:TonB family protein